MPRLGMTGPGLTGRWPGYAAPAAALLLTLLLTWLTALVAGGSEASATVSGLALLVLMPAPLLVAVAWGGALVMGRPHRLAPAAAAVWLLTVLLLVPHDFVWGMLGHVVAGLAAGLALGLRWRLDKALLVLALVLSPILVWTTVQVPVDEQLQMTSDEMLKALERNLPVGATAEQRAEVLAGERRKLAQITAMAAKVYPFVLAVGVLGQAGIILALLWLVMRAMGMDPHRWRLPTFSRWRVPFYVVWVLVGGIGMLLTRQPYLANAGLNLALLAAMVLSVQGIAVQFCVTGRMMSKLGRVFYWSVMGFFFAPLIMASGVVLGLADQWWDIRRLQAGKSADEDADDNDNDNDEDADDDLGADPR